MSRRHTLSLQHVFAGERLQGSSDAVFSIIATFMVVPLTVHVSVQDILKVDSLFQSDLLAKHLIYFFSFYTVSDIWFSHVTLFSIIEQVDDIILNLNLLVLLFVSALPICNILLVSSFGSDSDSDSSIAKISVALCSGDIVIIGSLMVAVLLYVFWKQRYLHPEILSNSEIRFFRYSTIISLSIKPFVALITLVVSLSSTNIAASYALLFSIGGIALAVRIGYYIYFKIVKKTIDKLPNYIFKTVASKFRIEFFSDGIFAIVATLIILDITTEAGNAIDGNKLSDLLIHHPNVITSYVMSFTVVGFLWLIHYQMFHFIKKLTPSLVIVNYWILFLTGLIPFASKLDVKYSKNILEYEDLKKSAVQLKCSIIFLVSLLEAVFWVVALFQKKKCMSVDVENFNSEILQFSKTLVLPIMSLVVFFGCLVDGFITYYLDIAFFLLTPLIYLLLDGTFYCYGRIKQKMVLKAATRKILRQKMMESRAYDSSVRTNLSDPVYQSYQSSLKGTTGAGSINRPRSQPLKVQVTDHSTSYVYSHEGSFKQEVNYYDNKDSHRVLSRRDMSSP